MKEMMGNKDTLCRIAASVDSILPRIKGKKVLAGFDGFVDTIVRPVSSGSIDTKEFFNCIEQFGEYIKTKKGKSASVELVEQCVSAGGNAPNFSEGAAELGIQVCCIGALGYPDIDHSFGRLKQEAEVYSIGNPGKCIALEFGDGKIMLSYPDALKYLSWAEIGRIMNKRKLSELFSEADGYAFLNWSELPHSNDIWRGIAEEICTEQTFTAGKPLLIDFCDFSGRRTEELSEALEILMSLKQYFQVIVSMNENETVEMARFFSGNAEGNMEEKGKLIYESMKPDGLVIHTIDTCYAWENSEEYRVNGKVVINPVISTGAGDRFNAGLCMGLFCDLPMDECLLLANRVTAYFLETGKSGTWDAVRKSMIEEEQHG